MLSRLLFKLIKVNIAVLCTETGEFLTPKFYREEFNLVTF